VDPAYRHQPFNKCLSSARIWRGVKFSAASKAVFGSSPAAASDRRRSSSICSRCPASIALADVRLRPTWSCREELGRAHDRLTGGRSVGDVSAIFLEPNVAAIE
jgi:hypothetical protein